MNELVFKSEKGNPVTSSLLVAEKFDKEHKHVLDAIRNLVADNSAAKYFYQTTYANRGKFYPQYIMNRDGFSLLVMGFTGDKALKFKIDFIEAFNAMESRLKLPQTFAEALQLAADQAKQIELMAPKAESYDQFIDSKSLQGFKEVANLLGMGRNRMMGKLRKLHILTDHNIPYQNHLEAGRFEVKESTKNEHNVATTYVTPKGIEYIRKRLIDELPRKD